MDFGKSLLNLFDTRGKKVYKQIYEKSLYSNQTKNRKKKSYAIHCSGDQIGCEFCGFFVI